jgi:hypothetical protein
MFTSSSSGRFDIPIAIAAWRASRRPTAALSGATRLTAPPKV